MPFPPAPEERRCTGIRQDGTRCVRWTTPGLQVCHKHDPDHVIPDEQRCTGKITGATRADRAGERCRNAAIPGGTVCDYHGGSAPHVKAAGKQRVLEQKARKVMETYGKPLDITPDQALLAEVRRTAGHVAWLEQQIQALAPGDLVWGLTRVKEGGDDRGTTEEAAPNIWLKLYWDERDRLVRVCAAALRAGIEERQVKFAESQGALVAQMIRAILADLHLTPAQQALVSSVVPLHLRALALAN